MWVFSISSSTRTHYLCQTYISPLHFQTPQSKHTQHLLEVQQMEVFLSNPSSGLHHTSILSVLCGITPLVFILANACCIFMCICVHCVWGNLICWPCAKSIAQSETRVLLASLTAEMCSSHGAYLERLKEVWISVQLFVVDFTWTGKWLGQSLWGE